MIYINQEDEGASGSSSSSKPYLPPGYRFVPTDYEVCYHLHNKINNGPILIEDIKVVDLYKSDPMTLSEMYPPVGVNEWYFFTLRNRKYPNGFRPNRKVCSGYWKATGADKPIEYNGQIIGQKKTLVFMKGSHQDGVKTNWIMHEFTVGEKTANDMKNFDEWALCRIYERKSKVKGNSKDKEDQSVNTAADVNTPDLQGPGLMNTQFQSVDNKEEDSAKHDAEYLRAINGLTNYSAPPSINEVMGSPTPNWPVMILNGFMASDLDYNAIRPTKRRRE